MWRRKIKVLSSYIGVFARAKSCDMLNKHLTRDDIVPGLGLEQRLKETIEIQLGYRICSPPFSLIHVSKISVSLACY